MLVLAAAAAVGALYKPAQTRGGYSCSLAGQDARSCPCKGSVGAERVADVR